ncbi:MAG: serine hydrolase [Ekhidna sp.]|nr:serine hydrolase [Ekhidna sp.]
MIKSLLLILLLSFAACNPQKSTLEKILDKGSPGFRKTLRSVEHEVQIIYGEISRDTITHHYFGDTSAYFYPASTIKMLNAFAALQWMEENNLAIDARLLLDSNNYHPQRLAFDSLFNDSLRIDNLFKKIFVYSDNQASNILFNLIGKDYINALYHDIGIDTRIVHQLGESAYLFSSASNNRTSKAVIYDDEERLNLASSQQKFISSLHPENQVKGKGYINESNELIAGGFDFSGKNYVPLAHLLGALERVILPELFDRSDRFNLNDERHDLLMEIMNLRPGDLPPPIDTLADNYVKFLIYGDQSSTTYPSSLTILNKVGLAYGYLTDVAFIRDDDNEISFFLAATVHVNSNRIYNDGKYEYEEAGLPFLGELGRLVYAYELERKSAFK